jgi:hypothetical protein
MRDAADACPPPLARASRPVPRSARSAVGLRPSKPAGPPSTRHTASSCATRRRRTVTDPPAEPEPHAAPGQNLLECLRDREADVLRFTTDAVARRTGVSGTRYPVPGRRRRSLSGRVRVGWSGPVPSGLETALAGTSWHAVSDEGGCGAGHRGSHWPAAEPSGRGVAGGDLRALGSHLRDGPAFVQAHTASLSGGSRRTSASSRR